ncbi:MAG: PA14 domain-containing protein, partial [Planctomycetota bacterium]
MRKTLFSLVLIGVISTVVSAGQVDLSRAKIVLLNPEKKILANAADMLADEIEKRTRIGLEIVSRMPAENEVAIVIGTAGELAKHSYTPGAGFEVPQKIDGYSLWTDTTKRKAATICAAGYDDRGTLFAVGRLLRLLEMSRDKIAIDSDVQVATAPVTKLRGHQIGYRPKTNSYDGWTLEMWEQYYRDMIVFGTNAIELLPPVTDDALDSPHFPKPPLNMMIKMSQLAKDYGLDVWIWFPAMADDYSDPKVMAAALKEWEEIFRSLPKIDVVFVPGGDPGNSHPSTLFPFMQKQKKNLNKYHPKGQIWMSPQGFDWRNDRKGWLKDFYNIMQNDQPKWLGGIVFGPQVSTSLAKLRKAIPPQYPIRRYPDITHSGGGQYEVDNWDDAYDETLGREPINPRPYFYAKIYRKLDQYAVGFITYSEGCNDDVNKIIWSCLGWDPDMKVADILKEYSRYFVSLRYEDKFAKGLAWLERNWQGDLEDNDGVYETLKLFQEMEKDSTPQEKLNWRFQQGLYRAYYDAYVKARLPFEKAIEKEAEKTFKNAKKTGSLEAIERTEAILDRPFDDARALQWRRRIHELAEALYQSAQMQLSVPKYKAIREGRGATLDTLDAPLNDRKDIKKDLVYLRQKLGKQTAGDDQYRPGLAGTDFDDDEFTEPDDGINILYNLDQHWAASQGNDWRAAWFGFIEGPFTGEVEFSALAIDGVELKIGDKVVIDGLENKSNRSGVVKMTKGQKLPVVIKFVTYESKAHLRMFWQWDGAEKSLIPPKALSYKLSALDSEVRFEFEYKGVENAGNWDNYHTIIPDVPAGKIDVSGAKIIVLQDNKILNNAADMLVDEISKRSRLDVPVVDKADGPGVYFILGTKSDISKKGISLPDGLAIAQKKDAYALWVDVSGKTKKVFLIGHDKRGALFAAGRLLRLLDMGRDWAYLD